MFFEPGQHPLPHDPLKALVQPRPIGWISSLSSNGTANPAPYSFFNLVADFPPYVFFGSAMRKDSQDNMATWDLREAMNRSSASVPNDVDEFELSGLKKAPSHLVRPPRVAESPAALECVYTKTVTLPGDGVPAKLARPDGLHFFSLLIGRVVGVYINEDFLTDGQFDALKAKPIARGGYMEYNKGDDIFTMGRPE